MDILKDGFMRLRQRTEKMGDKCDKVMKQALNSQVVHSGAQMMQGLSGPTRGTSMRIGSRVVVEDRQISEGGFAFVWAVHDARTHDELALKKIICQDRAGLKMARREIAVLERLPAHPNIVRYYGHVENSMEGKSNEVCLLFEMCTGGHLLDLLNRSNGVLSEKRILDVFRDICLAVQHLHLQSPPIQHRDLKVENVLLGSDGRFKLLDFGSWSDECSHPGSLNRQGLSMLQEQIDRYTTMMYRPPEMVDFYQEFPISEKVDIWMMGCILYTLMFCRHPFQDESPLAIANARYIMPSTPKYSDKMVDLTHWLLARDPRDRPSADQILHVLQNFSEDASLPLPTAVVERREKDRRLYEDGPLCGTSSTGLSHKSKLGREEERPKKREKDRDRVRSSSQRKDGTIRRHSGSKSNSGESDFWGHASLPPTSDTDDPWSAVMQSASGGAQAWPGTWDWPPATQAPSVGSRAQPDAQPSASRPLHWSQPLPQPAADLAEDAASQRPLHWTAPLPGPGAATPPLPSGENPPRAGWPSSGSGRVEENGNGMFWSITDSGGDWPGAGAGANSWPLGQRAEAGGAPTRPSLSIAEVRSTGSSSPSSLAMLSLDASQSHSSTQPYSARETHKGQTQPSVKHTEPILDQPSAAKEAWNPWTSNDHPAVQSVRTAEGVVERQSRSPSASPVAQGQAGYPSGGSCPWPSTSSPSCSPTAKVGQQTGGNLGFGFPSAWPAEVPAASQPAANTTREWPQESECLDGQWGTTRTSQWSPWPPTS